MADANTDPDSYRVKRVMLSEEQIQQRVREMGAELTERYRGRQPVFVTLLKGGFIFLADLCRSIDIPLEVEFMMVRSYEGGSSSGTVEIVQDLKQDIEGRHIILVEDIVDTGLTLSFIREHLELRNPASLIICALLDKHEARKVGVKIDLTGFLVENEFIVGYGLDYNQSYRNLPYLAVIEASNS